MAALVIVYVAGWRSNVLMAVTRFPTYFLGMIFGAEYAAGRAPGKRNLIVSYVVGVIAMIVVVPVFQLRRRYLWYYGLYWNLFVIASPFWMYGITKLLEWQDRIAPGRWVNKAWSFLGARSFEIYLCHLALYDSCLKMGIQGWKKWILIACLGTGIGIAFHEVVERCLKWWKQRKTA